jgi:hypothetical protein
MGFSFRPARRGNRPKNIGMKAKISKSMIAASNLTPPIDVAKLHDGSTAGCTPRAV